MRGHGHAKVNPLTMPRTGPGPGAGESKKPTPKMSVTEATAGQMWKVETPKGWDRFRVATLKECPVRPDVEEDLYLVRLEGAILFEGEMREIQVMGPPPVFGIDEMLERVGSGPDIVWTHESA